VPVEMAPKPAQQKAASLLAKKFPESDTLSAPRPCPERIYICVYVYTYIYRYMCTYVYIRPHTPKRKEKRLPHPKH